MAAKKQCLIIDDSDVIRKVARQIIASLNYDVHEAENGQRALDHCQAAMPDVIFVDWHMPVMAGPEFISTLRQQPGGDRPLVIYCTTESDSVDIARVLTTGANDYILKPYDRQGLTAKLADNGLAA